MDQLLVRNQKPVPVILETRYTYNAAGQKLRVVHNTAKPNITNTFGVEPAGLTSTQILNFDVTDYLLGGSLVVQNNMTKMLLFDGGYAKAERINSTAYGYTLFYYNQDHLGNIREVMNASGNLQQKTNYYPFGGIIADICAEQNIQPYKYNGKELDLMHGLNTYDYRARQYYPILCRWDRVDPLCEKNPEISPYAYCGNNPIRFIDINGLEPGDFFKTKDEAAIDFGLFYNDNSIRENSEYGSTIFRIKNSKGEIGYTYTVANVGKRDGVIVSKSPDALNDVATIHTHGAYSNEAYYDNEFSGLRTTENNNYRLLSKTERIKQKGNNDIGNANRRKLDSYLVTPNGSLQKYEPNSNKITIVSNDMPSDKNDPSRLNLKDSQERNPYTMEDFLRMINKVFFNQ